MTSVILQPAAGPDAQQHYRDTMESPVALSRIQPHVSASVMADLTTSGSGGGVRVWGVTPSGESKWNRIQPGDLVLFAGHGRFFASAQVIATAHSWGLADDLWGDDDDGRRWEFTYFTTPPESQDIPYAKFNAIVGYKSNYFPRGFSVLDAHRSGLYLATVEDHVAVAEYAAAVQAIDVLGSLDAASTTMVRREQSALRRVLLGNKSEAVCGICGRLLPVSHLVAAHIKQRSECTLEEKGDIPHIAMPMCNLGCDGLYEAGEVTVEAGVVRATHTNNAALKDVLDGLSGNHCTYWNPAREPYFMWHRENRFKY